MNKIINKLIDEHKEFTHVIDGDANTIYITIDDEKEITIVENGSTYDLYLPNPTPFERPTKYTNLTENDVLKRLGYEEAVE